MRVALLVAGVVLALATLAHGGAAGTAQPPSPSPTPTRPPSPPSTLPPTAPPFTPPSPTPTPSTDLRLPLPGSVTLPPFGHVTFRGPERIPLPPTPAQGQTPIPVRPLPPVIVEVRSFSNRPAAVVVANDSATISVAEGLAIEVTSWSGAVMPCFIADGLPHAVRCRVEGGRVPTLISFTTVAAPPPPGTVPIPGNAAIPPYSVVRFFGRPPLGAGITDNVEVVSETDQLASATYDGQALTLEVPAGFAVQLTAVTAAGVDVCPTQSSAPQRLTCRLSPHPPAQVVFTAIPVAADGFTEAALDLTSPCIPEFGRRWCDGVRLRLWRGDAALWASLRGVTDPEERFTATVLLRVQAGDPAAIGALARILGWPYVKVTRIRFLANEFVEVTNLGGGGQDLTGWQLRAGTQGRSFSLPTGVVLGPGERCTLYNGPALNPGVYSGIYGGTCEATTATTRYPAQGWWPDAGGTVELYDSTLDVVVDATLYDADPNRQPPPPHVQVVPVTASSGRATTPEPGTPQPRQVLTPVTTTPPPGTGAAPATLTPATAATTPPPSTLPPGALEATIDCGAARLDATPDPTIAVPTAVQATHVAEERHIRLTWRDEADNETCYGVLQTANAPSHLIVADRPTPIIIALANATDATTLARPGRACFRLYAGNRMGRSALSEEACVEVPAPPVPPTPPPGDELPAWLTRFRGRATLYTGEPAAGLVLEGYMGEGFQTTLCGRAAVAPDGAYTLDVFGAAVLPGCGHAGDSVRFTLGPGNDVPLGALPFGIQGYPAGPNGVWQPGTVVALDLRAITPPRRPPIFTPLPTPAPP